MTRAVPWLNPLMTGWREANGVRLSRDITGWAFMVEVDGVRHAGLAVGLAGISLFTAGDGAGGREAGVSCY
ncbi:hypothetical protein [Streptomyces sp. NPDC058291]|jgi:hypothetical protein|uniref:hypothetical protein n=1 Tax=Streptomyces sp. NPDC058291 TaxID=3346427 RepID=UPI0036E474CC